MMPHAVRCVARVCSGVRALSLLVYDDCRHADFSATCYALLLLYFATLIIIFFACARCVKLRATRRRHDTPPLRCLRFVAAAAADTP